MNIDNAVREAIYWWNRDEGYFHGYFSVLHNVCQNEQAFDFFTNKIFGEFLTTYSVRRNIAAGKKNVTLFLETAIEYGFHERVAAGDVSVIDSFSHHLKNNSGLTAERHCRSLLSKFAFLINPSRFVLQDSFVKQALWSNIKTPKNPKTPTKQELDTYSIFIETALSFSADHSDLFLSNRVILNRFKGTPAYAFFSSDPDAFKLRVLDKYLWSEQARRLDRGIDNTGYDALINYQTGTF